MTRPVLVIAGPTASGKTAAALAVARAWGAVVVSADAMQVYRYMDIGTAKATPEEQRDVPHVGIDLVDPDEPFDAADFVRLADAAIGRGGPVVVAGGTSLYIRSLLRGLVQTPPVDAGLRSALEQSTDWRERLESLDPVLAGRLHPNDKLRHVRGLEVVLQTGERLSDLHDAHAARPDRHVSRGVWFERSDLHPRIDARVLAMMDEGYLEEVRALLARGYGRDLKPMMSLGYRHLVAHLLDDLPLDEAIRLTQRDTRRFARKQRTWMRNLGFQAIERDHVQAAMAAAEALWGPAPGATHSETG